MENIYICMELLSKNTLDDYIIGNDQSLEEDRAREIAKSVGLALRYIHEKGVVLRNLDAKSILLAETETSKWKDDNEEQSSKAIPRILRLDKAQIMGYDERTYGLFGDIRYRAPEVIMGTSYNNKADAWSFGVILFYMLTGTHPFDDDDVESSPVAKSWSVSSSGDKSSTSNSSSSESSGVAALRVPHKQKMKYGDSELSVDLK